MIVSVASFVLTSPRGPLPLDELQKGIQGFQDRFKSVKLKTENGETEYTEMVDAEGNVHLAPKIVTDAESAEAVALNSTSSQR